MRATWRLAATALSSGLVLLAAMPAAADDPPEIRPYARFHFGPENAAYHFVDPDAGPVALESPSQEHYFGGGVGADIGEHWGFELGLDYVKTDLKRTTGEKAGDYSTTSVIAQLRYRWPLADGRIAPYVMGGGGLGLGEFSGREDFAFAVGGRDWAPLGALGVGLDYFFEDNLALVVEARYLFGFRPEIVVGGAAHRANADAIGVSAGLRVYLDGLGRGEHADRAPPAADSDERRIYIALRGGKAWFTDTDAAPGLRLDGSSGLLGNAALGVNFDRHWGAELAFEYTRAQVRSPTLGPVSGYPVGSIEALLRLRQPILDGRASPYLLAGPGFAYGEGGDADQPYATTGFDAPMDWSAVAVFGAGIDYFLTENAALNFEIKRVALFETAVSQFGAPMTLSPDFVSVSSGLRIFF